MPWPKKYDLELFLALNEEYAGKRVVKKVPPIKQAAKRRSHKEEMVVSIDKQLKPFGGLRGKRVLDFGCGRGDLSMALAEHLGCSVVGVDIGDYEEWQDLAHNRVELRRVDLCDEQAASLLADEFEVIVSNSVLEHVAHPYAALRGLHAVLRPRGLMWLQINLHRGPLASHRYRDVFFPWPHLLFSEHVFAEFYSHLGKSPKGPAWVNRLTHLHYRQHFAELGLETLRENFSKKPFDVEFYNRFEDMLGRYPRSDLEKDFIKVVLRKPKKGLLSGLRR